MNIIPILADISTNQIVNGPSVDRTISLGQMAIVFMVPAIITVIRTAIPKIPRKWVPFIAPILGALIDLTLNYLHLGNGVGAVGAVLGTAGIGVRELSRIRKKEPVIPSVNITGSSAHFPVGFGPTEPKPPYNGPGSPANP